MRASSTAWAVVFSLVSGVYWYVVAQFLDLIAPMMLNDHPLLARVLTEAGVMLALYVGASILFFRWLVGRERI